MSASTLKSRPHSVPYTQTAPPGINIYRLRIARGWSQGDLAKACRPPITPSNVSRIERNQGFTQDTLQRIAVALGVDYQALFYPPEIAAYASLPRDVRDRLAGTIQDVAAAYDAKRPPRGRD